MNYFSRKYKPCYILKIYYFAELRGDKCSPYIEPFLIFNFNSVSKFFPLKGFYLNSKIIFGPKLET